MAAYDRKLYNNLPLYARLADEEGILKHICDVLQVEIDKSFTALYKRQFLFDAEAAPDEWMPFLGQFLALSPQGQNYLGTGVNPEWSTTQKRTLLLNAWKYWQKKGTPQGIREAIWLWLGWEGALNPTKLHILQPFSDRPTSKPDNWFSWGTLYHENLLRTHQEKSFLGAEQIVEHSPNYLISEDKINPNWHRPEKKVGVSQLSPGNLWLHLILQPDEWTQIFPNISKLLPEAVPAGRKPVVFGWLRDKIISSPVVVEIETGIETVQEIRYDGFQWGIISSVNYEWGGTILPAKITEGSGSYYQIDHNHLWATKTVVFLKERIVTEWEGGDIFDYAPVLAIASDAKNWFLNIKAEKNLYRLPATTIFWYKGEGVNQQRSFQFSLTQKFDNLFTEFVFAPPEVDSISEISLQLGETTVHTIKPQKSLAINPNFNAGFQFFVPFRLPGGVSLEELLLIIYWLPILKVYSIRLELFINGDPMANLITIPLPAVSRGGQAVVEFEETLEQISSQLDTLLEGGVDKHYSYTISEPTLSLVIQHNLDKHPAVDFIDAINGIGSDAIAEVRRIDENSIEITFSQPRTGVVIFN